MLITKKPKMISSESARARQKEETRRRILGAARALFHEKSYQETRSGDIAERAGVSHGTVFAHFESKAALLGELNLQWIANAVKELRALPRSGTVNERYRRFIKALWARHHRDSATTSAFFSMTWLWEEQFDNDYAQAIAALRAIVEDILRDGIRQGEFKESTDPKLVAEGLEGIYFNVLRSSRFGEESEKRAWKHGISIADHFLDAFRT